MNEHDKEWAKNFIRSMQEGDGRHNSNVDFYNYFNPYSPRGISRSPNRNVGFVNIKASPELCNVGDVVDYSWFIKHEPATFIKYLCPKLNDYLYIETNEFLKVIETWTFEKVVEVRSNTLYWKRID